MAHLSEAVGTCVLNDVVGSSNNLDEKHANTNTYLYKHAYTNTYTFTRAHVCVNGMVVTRILNLKFRRKKVESCRNIIARIAATD